MRLHTSLDVWIMFSFFHFCSASNCRSGYEANIKDTSLQNKVLLGRSFKNFTKATFQDCLNHCAMTCGCESFNLEIGDAGTGGLCELNDADKEEAPGSLSTKVGFIHVYFRSLTKEDDSNAKKMCCMKRPCHNGATCRGKIRSGKPSFLCKCKEGYMGRLCENKLIKSCDEYLRNNKSVSSGLYKIHLGDQGVTKTVFCHFDHLNSTVWTLVQSYAYYNNEIFKWLWFGKNKSLNEENPDFHKYRASLGLMTYLKQKSSFWRATCNYDTKVNDDDYMQSSFASLDIMGKSISRHHCTELDVLRINGITYRRMSTSVVSASGVTFHILPNHGMYHKCDVGLAYPDRGLFGYYAKAVPNHGCAASSKSTTQYWFGTRL